MKNKMNSLLKVFLLLPLGFSLAANAADDALDTLKVGVVPQFSAEKVAKVWEPILAAVSAKAGVKLQLDASLDIPAFEKRFNKGDFDLAYMNPYHAIVANREVGYQPILRDVGRTLYGILVVKKDSDIKSINDLSGKKVAFPAPNALGAALIPRAEFAQKHKIKVEEMYVSSHSSVYLNVILGIAQAGGGVQKTLQQQPDEIRAQLQVINKTTEVPPHPITVHPRVSAEITSKIRDAFLSLGQSVEGKEMLGKIPMKLIGEAELSDYDELRAMGLDEFYIQ